MCFSIRKSIQSLPRLQLSMRLCGAPVPHLSPYPSCRFAHLPNAPAVREPHSCAASGMAPLVRAASGRFWIRRRNISAGDELHFGHRRRVLAARRLPPHEFFGTAFWLRFTLTLVAAETSAKEAPIDRLSLAER